MHVGNDRSSHWAYPVDDKPGELLDQDESSDEFSSEPAQQSERGLGGSLNAGLEMASRITTAAIVVGLLAYFGNWLDQLLGWQGPCVIAASVIGLGYFFLQLFRVVHRPPQSRG